MKNTSCFIVSMIIFGAVGVFAKYINMSSGKIALSLSLIGAIFLAGIILLRKQKLSRCNIRKNLPALLIAGGALCGNWIFLFQAYKKTTIANAALSYYFAPVLVIIFSPMILKEKISLKKIICIGIALSGLFLILQSGTSVTTDNHLSGIFYGLIAAGFYAALTLSNKFISELDGMKRTLIQLSISVMLLLPFVYFTDTFSFSSLTAKSIVLILLLGILHGGIGFYLFFNGMKGLTAQSIAILSYVDPLTSLVISVLIIKEQITLLQIGGAVLLSGAILTSETDLIKSKTAIKKLFKK